MNKFSEHIVIQRFKNVYNFLYDNNQIRGKSDLAKKLDTYNHVINDILKGKRNVTVDQLNKLFSIFNINANYLFGLSDELFLDGETVLKLPTRGKNEMLHLGKRNIRLIQGVRAFAGQTIDLQDAKSVESMPKFSVPGLEGNLFAIEIEGDSMSPTLTNGDLVVSELLETTDPLRNNQVYVVVTDTVVAKRVQQIKEGNELTALKLISDNDKVYKPYNVSLEEIRHILKVKCRLTTSGMN